MPDRHHHAAPSPDDCPSGALSGLGSDTDSYRPGADDTSGGAAADVGGGELPPELANHPRYELVAPLGMGGMGCVYKARHRFMDRLVALKVIHPRLLGRPAMVERFLKEAQAAARLDHPNIVRAFDADQAGSRHFLVMEYVPGVSLDAILAAQGRMAIDVACDYGRQAALGLQHAHERGMVHRDIKPHNLMLTPDKQVKVLDFGLARFVSETAAIQAAGAGPSDPDGEAPAPRDGRTPPHLTSYPGVGTPDYMAPEEILDPRKADIRADLYSLGCTLYRFLTCRVPFPAENPVEKARLHLEREPEPLTRLRPDVPTDLSGLVERMLAKEPARRPQTPAEVARALARFAAPPAYKLLLVEDEAASRNAMALALEGEGYAVARAANGREALEQLRGRPLPDLIVLDLLMPVMNGWELLRTLKGDPVLAGVPVVVLSGAEDSLARARALGIADYLQKPLPVEELAKRIRRHAAHDPLFPQAAAAN